MSGQHSNCPGKALGIKPGIADSRHTNGMTKRSPGGLRLEGAEWCSAKATCRSEVIRSKSLENGAFHLMQSGKRLSLSEFG